MVKLGREALKRMVLGLVFLAPATDALAGRSFTAEAVETRAGQPPETGRVFYAEQGMRFEFRRQGKSVVQIFLPGQGLMRVLFPEEKTYLEFQGPVSSSRLADTKPETPCPAPNLARCERVGSDTIDGVAAEIWRVTPLLPPNVQAAPLQGPTDIWWDKQRKVALREKGADGSLVQTRLTGQKQHGGRTTDLWETVLTGPDGQPRRTVRWHDPELNIDVHEEHPNGSIRDLRNIVVTQPDPAWFTLPSDFRRLETPPRGPAPQGTENGGRDPGNHPQVQQ